LILGVEGFAGMAARDPRDNLTQTDVESGDGGPAEAASFISEAVAELAPLSQRHNLDMLTHLLEMARLEADDIIRRQLTPGRI
jgi:hypothetical protein